MKSNAFGRLFYLNFYVLVSVWLVGLLRLIIGITKGKPVMLIFILMLIATVTAVLLLMRLCCMIIKQLVNSYKIEMAPLSQVSGQWEWQYFVLGTMMFVPAFKTFAGYPTNTEGGGAGDSAASSCGSGGDASCGSSCGGCGGGD